MAEAPESEPLPSSSESEVALDTKEPDEPLSKKRKITDKEGSDKLEHRLGGILCCAVCLDLPQAAVYQCSNGHLMCAPCFTHLLADARLRDESATCPNCRVEISKTSASRNLAVEKTVSELPSECKFCTCVFPRHSLQHHEENTCEERLTGCRYACIGCPWRGPAHEARGHEARCAAPAQSGADVLAALAERERRARDAGKLYAQVLDLLSYEKITFNDLQLKPYRTEEFVHKLYYETSRFSAFGHQWVVKAFVNKNQRDPTQSSQREISYQLALQLILKSKPAQALGVQWLVLRGPYGEARLRASVSAHSFAEDCADAPPLPLPLLDAADTNRLLSNKAIHFRLIMFLASK
ncbi:cysteine and histidine-rich protein 1 homolog isoform X2 [Trichoplusia ni]|uniref:Cysteine and histidine-rich protein 1 homolog isoform X2 n=1 Tax=Trichoplusia ni TaxID=7111 RepID=A0A7E5WTB5_TRINI|nr:cysteine and histidine-rich protein 1 homolog isoform X2 [Trichoplusia ni]